MANTHGSEFYVRMPFTCWKCHVPVIFWQHCLLCDLILLKICNKHLKQTIQCTFHPIQKRYSLAQWKLFYSKKDIVGKPTIRYKSNESVIFFGALNFQWTFNFKPMKKNVQIIERELSMRFISIHKSHMERKHIFSIRISTLWSFGLV